MNDTPSSDPGPDGAPEDDPTSATLDTLEEVLDDVRQRHADTPQWEFCEGMLTALLCMRRPVEEYEWVPAVFGRAADDVFASPGESTRFFMGWMEREAHLRAALEAPVESLDDERALSPAVMDWRGLLASLPAAERAEAALEENGPPPALAQAWAAGFLNVVDIWADDWAPPRDRELADSMNDALDCIFALLTDDTAKPSFNLYDPDSPPSVSEARFEAFGEALWAVYDLYAIARSLGPRVAPVRNEGKVGRNDPCPCGSGKKYKKCHGK